MSTENPDTENINNEETWMVFESSKTRTGKTVVKIVF